MANSPYVRGRKSILRSHQQHPRSKSKNRVYFGTDDESVVLKSVSNIIHKQQNGQSTSSMAINMEAEVRKHGSSSSSSSSSPMTMSPSLTQRKVANEVEEQREEEEAEMNEVEGSPESGDIAAGENEKGGSKGESKGNSIKKEANEDALDKEATKRAEWPMRGIAEPGDNDCLFGRGGGTNHHPGNKRYRKMVDDRKAVYLASKRLDKPLVALEIIREWRAQDPPGRFLKQDEATKLWYDVGDRKAREKTSQALREKAPSKQQEGEEEGIGDGVDKQTRFDSVPSPIRGGIPRARLARDHSLGTEFIDGKGMSMVGFSWDEADGEPIVGLDHAASSRSSHSSYPYSRVHSHDEYAPISAPHHPHAREHSFSKNPLRHATVAQPARNAFGSPYGHPPPPPPLRPPVASPQDHHHSSSSSPEREHSLVLNPLQGASTSQPARNTFADEPRSMSWGRSLSYDSRAPPPPPHYAYPPPPPGHWGVPPTTYPPPLHRPSPRRFLGNTPSRSAFSRTEASFGRSGSESSTPSNDSAGYEHYRSRSRSVESHNRYSYDRSVSGSSDDRHHEACSSQDFSKIADLMSEDIGPAKLERSNSWGGYSRKLSRESSLGPYPHNEHPEDDDTNNTENEYYKDIIYRSQSMPQATPPKSSNIFPSPPRNTQMRKKLDTTENELNANPSKTTESGINHFSKEDKYKQSANSIERPSLIRKLSGSGVNKNNHVAVAPNGVQRPEPIKRDTSNQPETGETKRSVKRVVLSRDHSGVASRLKEQQRVKESVKEVEDENAKDEDTNKAVGAKISSGLSKATLLDRKLSVEINKLGLIEKPVPLDRLSTADALATFIDDGLDGVLPAPKPLSSNDRITSIDTITMDLVGEQSQSIELGDDLDLILENDPVVEAALEANPSGVNADIAEKWLRG